MVYFERTFTQPPSHCAVEPVLFLPTFPVATILLCLVKYNSGLCIENVCINDLILPSFQHPMGASECPQAIREVHYKKSFFWFCYKNFIQGYTICKCKQSPVHRESWICSNFPVCEHKHITLKEARQWSLGNTQSILLTVDEPSTDFGDLIIPAIEWRIDSNLDSLSFRS